MKTTTLFALYLLTAGPALAHTASLPQAHADARVWPVLIGCGLIALAAVVYAKSKFWIFRPSERWKLGYDGNLATPDR